MTEMDRSLAGPPEPAETDSPRRSVKPEQNVDEIKVEADNVETFRLTSGCCPHPVFFSLEIEIHSSSGQSCSIKGGKCLANRC